MKQTTTMRSLTTLATLREREMDRLQAELAEKEAVRQRYLSNLARMDGLWSQGGASGALSLALSVNCGNYKQTVMEMADAHRVELHLHEADMAVSQRALAAVWRKKEVLGKVLDRHRQRALSVQEKAERKQQDEMATRMWHRENAP